MTERYSNDSGVSRQAVIKVVAASAMLLIAAGLAYYNLSGPDDVVADELLASIGEQSMDIACQKCGATYTIPAKEYMGIVAELGGSQALTCKKCGDVGAWRAAAPIEHKADQWNGGFVGTDVLVSDLRAYHKAHPENANGVADSPEATASADRDTGS